MRRRLKTPGRWVLGAMSYVAVFHVADARPGDSPTPADNAPALDEVVVTARKQPERLLDTPVAVTALTSQDLAARSVMALNDVAQATPNLDFSRGAGDAGGAGFAAVHIRGIGQIDYSNATDPGVGIYADGVYLGRSIGAVLELPDTERVEILRGPQGTLFGKNTLGGAITIASHEPVGDDSGRISLTGGERSRLNADAQADIGLSDAISAFISASFRRVDGYVDRPYAGDHTGGENIKVTRGKLRFDLGGGSSLLLNADYSDIYNSTPRVYPVINPASSAVAPLYNILVGPVLGKNVDSIYASTNERTSNTTGPGYSRFKGGGVSAVLNLQINQATVRSISAYRSFHNFLTSDQDGQPAEISRGDYSDKQWQGSEELDALGTVFNGRLDYVTGLYYFHEDANSVQRLNLFADLFDALQVLPGPVIPSAPGVTCATTPFACFGGAGNPLNAVLDLNYINSFGTTTNSYAGFEELTYHLTSTLSAIAGVRYTRDDKKFYSSLIHATANVPVVPLTKVSKDWDAFSPRIGARWQPTRDLTVYGTVSRGFKSGGFNSRPQSVDAVERPFDPESLTSYEIGAKTRILDKRVDLNVAAFHYNYSHIQLDASGVANDGFTPTEYIENIGRARVNGIEGELIVRLVSHLTLNGAFGYTDAKYTQLGAAAVDVTLSDRLPKTPKWTADAGAELGTPLGANGNLTWRADYAYRSLAYNDTANTPQIASRANGIVNVRIGWANSSKRYGLAIYAHNLLDRRYLENGFNSLQAGGLLFATPNQPREVGGVVSFAF